MSDYAHRATDEALADLEKRISQVYADASNEMQGTVTEYFKQFAARDRQQAAAMEAGKITEQEYKQWRLTQLSRGERYKTMQSELAERYVQADEVAVSYVNDATPGIYSLNRNYSAYTIEQAGADVSFTLYDESTVRRLIAEQPNLMPNYPAARAVRRGIDLAYGKQQITASITSGILQGKDIYMIAEDLMSRMSTMSEESAVRTARTAFTAAENAGRQDSYEAAEEMGIPMQKRWVATLDDRTRESHIEADGQTVGVDESFKVGDDELEYPGDPGGEPCEIYNCRCTVIAVVDGNEYKDAERRGDGERFERWEALGTRGKPMEPFEAMIGANPNYGETGYDSNCQRCVQAYELRRRGYDVQALPKPDENNIIKLGNECFTDSSGKTATPTFYQTENEVKRELEAAPDGSRYVIYCNWDEYCGHVFSTEKINGEVIYVDAQIADTRVDAYFGQAVEGRFGYLRIDDKKITNSAEILKETVRRGE